MPCPFGRPSSDSILCLPHCLTRTDDGIITTPYTAVMKTCPHAQNQFRSSTSAKRVRLPFGASLFDSMLCLTHRLTRTDEGATPASSTAEKHPLYAGNQFLPSPNVKLVMLLASSTTCLFSQNLPQFPSRPPFLSRPPFPTFPSFRASSDVLSIPARMPAGLWRVAAVVL